MMDEETLGLLRGSLRQLLTTPPADIAAALADLGWAEVLAEDEPAATTALFEEQGDTLTTTAALDGVAVGALGLGSVTSRVIWPHPADGTGPAALRDGGRIRLRGIVLSALTDETAVVPLGDAVAVVRTGGLSTRPLGGLDPDAGWLLVDAAIDADTLIDAAIHGDGGVGVGESPPGWEDAVAAARRALASEILGVSRRALIVAGDHVRSRKQFGRAIGSYQSVRHRLAEGHAAVVGATALTASAWVDGTPWAAATAKAVAGWAHADVVRHAMQVCGGMGLSEEFPLHRLVRRGYLLDSLLGSARMIAREQGGELLAGLDPPGIVVG